MDFTTTAAPVVITNSMLKITNSNFTPKLRPFQRIRFPNDPKTIDWNLILKILSRLFSCVFTHPIYSTHINLAYSKHILRSIIEWIFATWYKSNASECIRYVVLFERRWKTWISLCLQTDKRKSLSENSSDYSDDAVLRRRRKKKSKRTKKVQKEELKDKEDGELSSHSDESVIIVEDNVTETRYEG